VKFNVIFCHKQLCTSLFASLRVLAVFARNVVFLFLLFRAKLAKIRKAR
jgi:hypothetical protein